MTENIQPNNQKSNSEEIDLGQLFKLIGDGFKKLFNFIGDLFKGVFNLIILFFIFIQKNIIKFVIVGVIGLIIGTFLDIKKKPRYVSTMVVEPNFQSVQQLYNNIHFYNELAEAKDSTTLAKVLKIEESEASSIKEITAESHSDENQKIKLFDEFVRSLDTTTKRTIDLAKYLENFNSFEARFHTIKVIATNSLVAAKIQPQIVNAISNNEYFKKQKETSEHNIELQKNILQGQLVKIDSLQQLYKRVMEKEAQKVVQGTNISLGKDGGQEESRELALIREIDKIKVNLVEINEEEANKSSILNVISDFPTRGAEVEGIFKKYKFSLPITLIGIVLFGLSLVEFNKFLKEVAAKQQQQK